MLADQITEVIFVGLPGPTHYYGGLSDDNVAATLNRGSLSNPKQAALQALDLVRLLKSLGLTVAVLPPQLRPHLGLLRQHFSGGDDEVIKQAAISAPALLEKACSSSAMWAANAATVAPGVDCADGRLHITTANLFTNMHRRIEADDTYHVLKHIFKDVPDCMVHAPLSAAAGQRDEGAANHMRLSPTHGDKGLHVFVYGASGSAHDPESARQTLSASHAVQLQHRIADDAALFVRQNGDVIREGVFHNDVIAVSNGNVLLVHERAYEAGIGDIDRIIAAYRGLHAGAEPVVIVIEEQDLSVEEAVHTYFFNSQIVTRPDGGMSLIAPLEVELLYEGRALALMEHICSDNTNSIDEIHRIDLRQSMRNGGGPACLRLRVPMTPEQVLALDDTAGVVADEALLAALEEAIERYYPTAVTSEDLADPALYHGCRQVLETLSAIMRLPLL